MSYSKMIPFLEKALAEKFRVKEVKFIIEHNTITKISISPLKDGKDGIVEADQVFKEILTLFRKTGLISGTQQYDYVT